MFATATTRSAATRSVSVLAGLAAGASGLTLAGVPTAQAADNPFAFVGDEGIVISSSANVNVREPGEGRTVVVPDGARVAFAAGERVVYEVDGRVLTRDLETTVRLRPGAGVDSQKLLGLREVGGSTIAVMQETREAGPGAGYAAVSSDLVTHDVITGERTVLRGDFNSFESGYSSAHVLRDGSVVAQEFTEAATAVQRYAADGTRIWGKRVGVDESVNLAVIGTRVSLVRNRTRGGEAILRIVRLDAGTGAQRSARSVAAPDATRVFCTDWRTSRRLACQTANGPVIVDAFDGNGIVSRVRAPRDAFISVIGGR